MGDDILKQEIQDHIGTLTLNRAEKRNALSPDLIVRIHLVLEQWAHSRDVWVVVITGSGEKAFSAGYDISSLPTEITPEMADLLRNHNPLTLTMDSMVSFPYPTIAMLNGYAYGAGLNLALCCDFRIAIDQISVSMPPVKLGLVYHPEGIRQFIEVVGVPRAREIFFTGRRYSGKEALKMGLVNELVPAEKLAARTYAVASEIASNAPLSLRGIKRIMNMFRNAGGLTGQDRREAEALMNEAYASKDLLEGQKAFFERRKPNFIGH